MNDLQVKLLEDVLNGVSDVALFLDQDRTIRAANAAAWRVFGQDVQDQNFVLAIRSPEVLGLITQCVRQGGSVQETLPLDGALTGTFKVTISAVQEAGVVLSFADLSHIRAAEQIRSDFVANVSHELRSPLTSISGFIETLQGPAQNDEVARSKFLDLMRQEAGRMDRLIGDLLSLSKVEGDSRVRPKAEVNIVDLASRVKAMLSHQASERNSEIDLHSAAKEMLVVGDDDQLMQVLRNLTENAIKYGAPGAPVRIELEQMDSAPGVMGGVLSIAVKDQGPGIDRRHLPRLTERFYRVDDGRAREKGGTGLGLAIVKHIVQRHRGRLLIESAIGEGSTFTVLLPLAAPTQAA